GQLTEAVRRRPYQIILFDEIEKAHPEVLNILLQLLDDGRLTDGRNRTVDFSNTVVIMTSNLGAEHFASRLAEVTHPRIGFGHDAIHNGAYLNANPALTADMIDTVLTAAKKALTSELWNRINERLVFGPLSRYEVARIARLQFNDSARRLAVDRNILIEADDTVFEYLIDHGGYDPELGARPMRTTLQRLVETTVADMILRQEVVEGQRVRVGCTEGQLVFQVVVAD
ncbi:MAG: AAA family ATPase, partial [Myxococcota bacterium]